MGWSKASRVWPLARWQSRPRPGSRTQPAAATFAVVGPVPQQQVDAPFVVGRRVLLVGDEELADAAGDRMVRVDDLDPEPLQRAMADVSAAHQVEIRAAGRIKSHRVVQVEEPAASLDERDHRMLLLGCHPDEIRRDCSRSGRWRPSRRITRSWTFARFFADRAFTSTVKWGTTPVASKTGRRPSSRWPGSCGWSPIKTRA